MTVPAKSGRMISLLVRKDCVDRTRQRYDFFERETSVKEKKRKVCLEGLNEESVVASSIGLKLLQRFFFLSKAPC